MAEACLLCAASNRSSWCTLPPIIGDAAGDQFSIVFGVSLPTADDAIAVDGIELAEVAPPARLVGGDHGRAAPAEEVEDDTAALGHILDRICNHLNRLDCRMQRQFIHPAAAKRVDALVGPHVGSIAPVLAKFEAVDVRRGPLLEGEDQFVPGSIEGAHSAVILDPDNQILELAEHVVGCRQHLARVAPIHAYEVYRAVDAYLRVSLERRAEKRRKLRRSHLACRHLSKSLCSAERRRKAAVGALGTDPLSTAMSNRSLHK